MNIFSITLYLLLFRYFNISKQFFRHFNYESIYLYFKFYIYFSIIFGLFVFFQKQFFIPRSLVFIFPSFFFFIILINRSLISFFFKFGRVYNNKKVVVIGFNPQIANTIINYAKVLLFVEDKNEKSLRFFNGIKVISHKKFLKDYFLHNFSRIIILDNKIFNKIRLIKKIYN